MKRLKTLPTSEKEAKFMHNDMNDTLYRVGSVHRLREISRTVPLSLYA